MADLVGEQLAHYTVTGRLGRGGMGEVYRATDSRLGREVAIKVLPTDVAADPDRLSRFAREARLLAALNHPNVATLYGLEEHDGQRFLVMELVDGESLAHRIKRGRLPIDEALEMACQVARGLAAAHAQGIVHRDLKPANVMLSEDGAVKVLDFGLAKALDPRAPSSSSSPESLAESPTVSVEVSRAGSAVGTAPYMSPEQARGKAVDKRTDIWAFGCLLWEMLSGRMAFAGKDASEVMASILKVEPDWSALPTSTPAAVRTVLRRCLAKDPNERLHDINDARIALEEVGEWHGGEPIDRPRSRRSAAVLAAAAIALAALGVVAGALTMRWLDRDEPAPVLAVQVEATEPLTPFAGGPDLAISPDGRHLVWIAWDGHEGYLAHRRLGELTVRRIPGTEGCNSPFFSPDSQWVGYHCTAEPKLRKSSLAGGDPIVLCQDHSGFGTWSPDGKEIILSPRWGGGFDGYALRRVPAAGGEATTILDFDPEERRLDRAGFLPDGRALLVELSQRGSGQALGDTAIAVLDLETLELTTLLASAAHPRYAPSGHLVFARVEENGGALYAVAFDADRRRVSGEPVRLRGGVRDFDLSANGTLAWVDARARQCWLAWVDRRGVVTRIVDNNCQGQPRLSPDGARVAMGSPRIVVHELTTGITQQLTSEGDGWAHFPVWSPDGERIVYGARGVYGDLRDDIFSIPADFSGASQPLVEYDSDGAVPLVYAPSGELVFNLSSAGQKDIWMLSAGGGEPRLVVGGEAYEQGADISPDGRWLAYSSNRSGTEEVYVEPFPDGGPRVQVSAEGGSEPRWSPVGDELFYRHGARMIAVPITLQPSFAITGQRWELFENEALDRFPWHVDYDVDHDGQRFLMVEAAPRDEQQADADRRINLIVNWFAELERLVPTT